MRCDNILGQWCTYDHHFGISYKTNGKTSNCISPTFIALQLCILPHFKILIARRPNGWPKF